MQNNEALVIIGCGQAKRLGVHKAADLYTSSYFRLKLAYARAITSDDTILILSGKYGFVKLNDEIASYDQHIGSAGAVTDATLRGQADRLHMRTSEVIVLGGNDYVKRMRRLWTDCKTPLNGIGGIGDQMSWLKSQTAGNSRE
jgi:hypothetical protein